MSGERWIVVGCVLAGLAVVFGAFAAHGLDTRLPVQYAEQTRVVVGETVPAARKYIADFKTAAEYQMFHALGMIACGLVAIRRPAASLNVAGWCFLLGTVLFSGSLYALVLRGVTKLGMITPFGGMLFIVGWVALAIGAAGSGRPTAGAAP
ncbi:hypothetical protein Pan44_09020 [Caulifigura coniformis]|uniref:DUF423 domain-containing protein n=1 Tax=Caulifigura coniformis TaxID=2527983 RepID=A0A517S9T5_9PLAN|nr:DUF423 domain-containing protein [Caulifigura coniformis]QDT52889.1 hypothetical protein Pan44_09020 [Caulifigura coniformis]